MKDMLMRERLREEWGISSDDGQEYWEWLEDLLEVAVRELDAIKRDTMKNARLHRRQCFDCKGVHWHVDNKTPYVLCPECGSQDTRIIKP
jgi:Zn finger protein HypA/HybF involved in hydrogenase expression